MPWQDRLLARKNLTAIFLAGPRFWTNKFNTATLVLVTVLLALFSTLDVIYPRALGRSGFALGETIRMWAAQGFTFTMTIVAFLIAGFTVLTTITKPELFAELAQVPHRQENGHETGLTEVEFIFFAFINVFVHYLAFLFVSTVILLFGSTNGPLAMLAYAVRSVISTKAFGGCLHVLFVLLGVWFLSLILRLKSFVWNIYQMVLIAIVAEHVVHADLRASGSGKLAECPGSGQGQGQGPSNPTALSRPERSKRKRRSGVEYSQNRRPSYFPSQNRPF